MIKHHIITNHTPGPWRTGDSGGGSYNDRLRIETVASHPHPQMPHIIEEVHTVIAYCREPVAGEGEANARLIAKSPELLAAAQAVLARVDARLDGDEPHKYLAPWHELTVLRQVIAQATGQGAPPAELAR